MIQMIEKEQRLKDCLHRQIEDAGIKVDVDQALAEPKYIGIKVDDYYKGLHEKIIPKAVDFIVAVDCECSWFALYILELRDVKRTCSSKEIQEKFDTVINRFMQEEFGHIFLKDSFKYKEVFLYLVTTSYQMAVQLGKFEEYQALRARLKAKDSLANDSTLTTKPYKFRGKYYFIRREVPPNPLIRAIH